MKQFKYTKHGKYAPEASWEEVNPHIRHEHVFSEKDGSFLGYEENRLWSLFELTKLCYPTTDQLEEGRIVGEGELEIVEQYSDEDGIWDIIWIYFPNTGFIADSDTRQAARLKVAEEPAKTYEEEVLENTLEALDCLSKGDGGAHPLKAEVSNIASQITDFEKKYNVDPQTLNFASPRLFADSLKHDLNDDEAGVLAEVIQMYIEGFQQYSPFKSVKAEVSGGEQIPTIDQFIERYVNDFYESSQRSKTAKYHMTIAMQAAAVFQSNIIKNNQQFTPYGYIFEGRHYASLEELSGQTFFEGNEPVKVYTRKEKDLKELSEITDEDAIEIAKIVEPSVSWVDSNNGKGWLNRIIKGTDVPNAVKGYQYLESRGYKLPKYY